MNMRADFPHDASDSPACERVRTLSLALQGCGAHGAFGWGILDRLLEDGRIDIGGLIATSTGAMNAAVFAYASMKGDKEQARAQLELFWRKISERASWRSTLRRSPMGFMFAAIEPFSSRWLDGVTQVLSPYEFNPLNLDPMRDILESMIDFGELRRCRTTQLAIYATNVRTGQARVFTNPQMTVDAVLASACQPTISQAVRIDGEYFWDGVYSGHPMLMPLMADLAAPDLLIGQISPVDRREVPRRAPDIQNRINEITLRNSLSREVHALAALARFIDNDWIKPEHRGKLPQVRIHAIRSDEIMSDLSVSSKFDTSWRFLAKLRDMGRQAAELWLEINFDKIGRESTIALPAFHS